MSFRKYRNNPTVLNGVRFDSKGEASRWCELQLLERGGAIKDLARQVRFSLKGPNGKHICFYIPDFVYTENRRRVVEDFKSKATISLTAFQIKKKLFEANYPEIEFRISQRRTA